MIFDNTIDDLLLEANLYEQKYSIRPMFISDWNPANENIINIKFHNKIDNKLINNYNYLYSIDDINYKNVFKNFCNKRHMLCEHVNYSLFSNSTIALYLTFKSLKLRSFKNILVFTPCYFTSESALLSLGFHIYFSQLLSNSVDDNSIMTFIKDNKIDSILITDPIYGIGLSLSKQTYISIINIVKKCNLTLIIDYSYGNMVWNETDHIFNHDLICTLDKSGIEYYLIDSLPKKLFLNGVKFSILFSSCDNIKYIEYLSLFIEGSITANQFKNYYQCYNEKNDKLINRTINTYIQKSRNTYNLIKSFLLNSQTIKMLEANSSIFALIGLRRKNSFVEDDLSLAKLLIKKFGVFVTPHSRYRLYDDSWFYFRVNLLLDKNLIIESLIKISSL